MMGVDGRRALPILATAMRPRAPSASRPAGWPARARTRRPGSSVYVGLALLTFAPPLAPPELHAAPPVEPSSAEIAKRLDRLAVLGSVLYVAAHPDDENTNLLSYLANGQLVRTAYLSLTRGDGGQNLIGSEQGVGLGIIRTQELLAARRTDGAEQLFTRARDFGFSKSVDESLKVWGEEEILADVVSAIRRFRPDVIINRFSASGGGHGHHTASARLSERAFKAAADPKYAPADQPRLSPWQATRLLWNRGGGEAGGLQLDVGLYDPLLGKSYAEISADSRSMHKSQGFGAAKRRGPIIEAFEVIAEAPGSKAAKPTTPWEGVDWTWRRIPGGDKIAKLVKDARQSFRPEAPSALLPALIAIDAAIDGIGDADWKSHKRKEIAELVAAVTGLFVEATTSHAGVVAGDKIGVTINALNRSPAALTLRELRLVGPALGAAPVTIAVGKPLPQHAPQKFERELTIPPGTSATGPYWLRESPLPGRFEVKDPLLAALPENPPAVAVDAIVETGGRRFVLRYPVQHKWTDPVEGERHRPLEVVPAVSVAPIGGALLFPDGKAQTLGVRVKAAKANTKGTLRLEAPAGYTIKPATAPFSLDAAGDETELRFAVQPPKKPMSSAMSGSLRALASVANAGGATGNVDGLSHKVDFISYPHIPIQMMLTPAVVRLEPVDLERGGRRIGYIPGAGDEVASSLERAGWQVTMLDDAALQSASLKAFDAIVTGVRAFNTNDRMPQHHARLMDYVKGGGTLVVQYNTANRLSKVSDRIGPLPFDISRDRVTDETAAVRFEDAAHPIFHHPNKLGPADFEGWVQERGLYFASNFDKGWEAPLSMADPGESPSRGSLIIARHGRGAFIYTGLAFFRQLPAGVPGAYRLFANLLAHGRTNRR